MLRMPVGHLSTVNTTLRQAPGLSAKTARCHFCQAKKNGTTQPHVAGDDARHDLLDIIGKQ